MRRQVGESAHQRVITGANRMIEPLPAESVAGKGSRRSRKEMASEV